MEQEIVAYLLGERRRVRDRLALLRSGQAWTSEMHRGQQMDTTAQTLSRLEDNLEEIDGLLCKAGISIEMEEAVS